MQIMKIKIPGNEITICLGYWEANKKIKKLDFSVFVDYAYQKKGYIGFDLKTGEIVEYPGPTIIKLYEITNKNEFTLQDLRNHFRQNQQRLQIEIEERVKFFYDKNYQIA